MRGRVDLRPLPGGEFAVSVAIDGAAPVIEVTGPPSRWVRVGAPCSACLEQVERHGGGDGGHACACEFSEVLSIWLPERFYDDHASRDLPAGLEVDRERSKVQVQADRSTFAEILDDARHQVYMAPELGREYLGLVSSARATVRVLEAAGIE